MRTSFFQTDREHRQIEGLAYRIGDLAEADRFLGGAMIARAGLVPLQRQPVEAGGVGDVRAD